MLEIVNIWAVLTAAIAAFILGGIWYAPPVFGKIWCKANGKELTAEKPKGHNPFVYVVAFIFYFISAAVFALFLEPPTQLGYAVGAGLLTGLGWVAMSFGINYVFAQRSIKLFLIDAGYHTLQFVVYGLVLGLWPK